MDSVVRLSRVKPDFEGIVSGLQGTLALRNSWKDTYLGSTGQLLIEHHGATGELMAQSVESAYREAFPQSAYRDSSIYAATIFLGVRVLRKLPGVQLADITRNSALNTPIITALTIPELSQFYISDIPFFNRISLFFSSAEDTLTSQILYQGRVVTKEFISDGSAFQALILPALNPMSISDTDIRVFVDTTEYSVVTDGLWHYGPNELIVSDATLGDGNVALQFGNGDNGNIPPLNAKITVKYAETLGANTGLIGTGTSVSLVGTLDGQLVKGNTVRQVVANTATTLISIYSLLLDSILTSTPALTISGSAVWSREHIGMQLECEGGLALITSIKGDTAKLSIVFPFKTLKLTSGSWYITTPSTGLDEKPASYYKTLAPILSRAQDRAITMPEYRSTAISYPGISDAYVIGERDLRKIRIVRKVAIPPGGTETSGTLGVDYYAIPEQPRPELMNNLWISVLTTSGIALLPVAWTAFVNWMYERCGANIILVQHEPTKVLVDCSIIVGCLAGYDLTVIRTQSEDIVQSVFATDKPMLNRTIMLSDIIDALKHKDTGVPGIDYITFVNPLTNFIPPVPDVNINTGIPDSPSYLYLNNLTVDTIYSNRIS